MVSVVNDTILENDEQFTVELQTADQAVTLDPQSSVVIISDNDGTMYVTSNYIFQAYFLFLMQASLFGHDTGGVVYSYLDFWFKNSSVMCIAFSVSVYYMYLQYYFKCAGILIMGFEQDAFEVNETDNFVTVCVNLTAPIERSVEVTLFTVGVTAQG